MESNNLVCPVCTLYLRPGITLKSHLKSHPKQKVIEALVRLTSLDQTQKLQSAPSVQLQNRNSQRSTSTSTNQTWNQSNSLSVNTVPQNFGAVQGNHSFIYQQFMSTSSPQPNVLNINPLTQQYVTIPTVFSPQMMCSPYVYQQQQVIMSSGSTLPPILPRPLPIEMPAAAISTVLPGSQDNSVLTISEEDDNLTAQSQQVVVGAKEIDLPSDNVNVIADLGTKTTDTYVQVESIDFRKDEEPFGEEIVNKADCDENELENIIDVKEDDVESMTLTQENDVLELSKNCQEFTEQDECFGSPRSHTGSDWSVRVRTDLSKACQTQSNSNNFSPPSTPQQDLDGMDALYVQNESGQEQQEFYYSAEPEESTEANSNSRPHHFVQNEPVYTAPNTVIASNDQINFVDMEGMQLMLSNDFMGGQLISQVEEFDNRTDRPQILMTIGGMECNDYREEDRMDESISRESAIINIRADERMPARGELSGQESNGGASDIAWSRIQYHEGSSQMSASYDLVARENWEVSDCSDTEISSQNRPPRHFSPDVNDTPTIVGYLEPPLNFKCGTCGDAFKCLQDRQQHVKEQHSHHPGLTSLNVIGGNLGKKKVKKIVVKPKKEEAETENNFDNVFTNKLKTEANVENEGQQPTIEVPESDKRSPLKNDLKLVCSICDSALPSRKLLQTHKFEVHNVSTEVRHKCATCSEAFGNEYKYTEHLRVHPLECRLCGKYFYRRQNMQLHMKRHLGIRPYKCDICEKAFLTKQKRDEHKNVHTGEAPIKCSLCNETFRRHSNLVQHRNLHHFNIKKKIKDFICSCGEIFHSKKKLAWHKEIHDAKPKSCVHCSEKFIHMASLTRHMRRAHNDRFVPKEERSTENVECPICKGVYLRSSLDVHIRNHSGQRPFTCLICNKDFTTKWNLKLHKWTHASRTAKPYRCDQCKGAFIRETDYIAHMNSHKSVRPYTCNYCGAQFIRKYNCQRHVKEHEKGKSFSCQICGKSFHRSYYLKDHMRVHSGVRPYSCHICGKTSTTKSNHNKHVRIHHARDPVSTEN